MRLGHLVPESKGAIKDWWDHTEVTWDSTGHAHSSCSVMRGLITPRMQGSSWKSEDCRAEMRRGSGHQQGGPGWAQQGGWDLNLALMGRTPEEQNKNKDAGTWGPPPTPDPGQGLAAGTGDTFWKRELPQPWRSWGGGGGILGTISTCKNWHSFKNRRTKCS